MSTLIWAVVPNGRSGGPSNKLQANIVVMPQLDAASLAEAGMAVWPPADLAASELELDFAEVAGAALTTSAKATIVPASEDGLWKRYFPAETPIVPDIDGAADERVLVVRPTGDDGAAAEQIFRDVAAAPLAGEAQRGRDFTAAVHASLARNPIAEPPPAAPARRLAPRPAHGARQGPAEFHDTLALLREHPTVQKALGLVLQLELAAPANVIPASGVVRVRWPQAPSGIPAIVSPWTAYELTDARFQPQSTEMIDAGIVKIATPAIGERHVRGAAGWRVLTVDVDAAAGAIRDAARGAAKRLAEAGAGAPDAPLPALRTGGIALARIGLQADMDARHERLRAQRVVTANTVITADQLLLGYRLDVQRDGDAWRSLTLREASYTVGGGALAAGPMREEGHLKAAAALDHGDGQLVTDEIVARWSGWSLAVRRPSFLTPDGAAEAAALRLGWTFDAVAGSLPRLRFGGRYRLRMRVADVGGGGLAADDPLAERYATDIIPFGRYEPIGSPQLLPGDASPALPGESDSDIVLRSDRDLTPAQFAAANPRYQARPARTLTTPLSSLDMAEQHGMLDGLSEDQRWAKVAPVLTGGDPKNRLALADPAAGGVAAYVAGMAGSLTRAWLKEWPDQSIKRIVPQAASDPLQPVISWHDDDLVVSLSQAGATTVELSSTIRKDFEAQMAAQLLMTPEAAAAARDGRHPLVTPAIKVQVTHATRKPLKDPAGTLIPSRSANETGAVLTPSINCCGIDPASTAQLEISADWSEPDDDQTVTVSGRMLKTMRIDRNVAELPELLRHEFGDTRHRAIRYTIKAVSRFRHCFFEDEPDDWFVAAHQTDTIAVPNSGMPPVVKILRTLPAFTWTQEATPASVVHQRRGLIRIQLDRPWYVTGEGEQLAVIVAADASPPPALEKLVSEAARDPIWNTGPVERWLSADRFSRASGPAVSVTPEGAASPVLAVPHAVAFDPALGCWYCDIAIDAIADASYMPLVRLALARFQPTSLDGLSLSPIVQTDFVALLPTRTLTIDRSEGGAVTASLSGLGPMADAGNVAEFCLETASTAADAAGPTVVADGVDAAAGWRANAVPATALLGSPARIPLPPAGTAVRLRVSEIERIPSRPGADAGEMARRVVFADLIVLS